MKIISRNNKLYLHFSHQGQLVRKSMKMDDTPKNRTILKKEVIPEIQKQLVIGEFFKNTNNPTFDVFAETSFSIHKHNRKEATQQHYQAVYKLHIKPTFGHLKLNDVKRSQFSLWQNSLLKKLTGKTVKVVRTVLMTILEDAYKEEIIEKNYLKLVDPPKVVETREKLPFSVEEIYNKVLDNFPKHMRAYFALGFFTGMRTGELIALQWENIDLSESLIKVRHSTRAGRMTEPKTKSSIRDIEILETLKPYLVAHKKMSREDSKFVFETNRRNPYQRSDKISSHYWKKILLSQNSKYRNLYQMRYTFASQMLMNNADFLNREEHTTTQKLHS